MDDAVARLQALSAQMSLEPDAECPDASHAPIRNLQSAICNQQDIFVHPAILPDGQRIKLLKTLLSSACERDCYYCPFRAGRDFRRASFQPEEFARLFIMLAQKGIAEGVFLSSGVAGGGVRTQDKLLDAADILRNKLGFRGYLHLKIMPGAERAQVERAMQLADRVSVNLEAPNTARLAKLAPHKQFLEELLQPLKWVDEIRRTQLPPVQAWRTPRGLGLDTPPPQAVALRQAQGIARPASRWPSTVTQFVAGGADESDLELLTATAWLHRHVHLKRAYFSGFKPVADTPLENKAPTDPLREHRLYQASFLLRYYGFDLEEMPFEKDGNLPLPTDPKLAWAQMNLSEKPVEINRAERRDLLRIPGIGPQGAERIIRARRQAKIRDISSLRRLGVSVERAAQFLLFDGKRADYQPALL